MPELPEAEAARTLVEAHCLGKVIAQVITTEGGGGTRAGTKDDIVYEGTDHDTFEKELTSRKFVAARRRGKQLWFETDGKFHPAFHFGMTGSFVVKGQAPLSYKRIVIDDKQWPPRFTKCEIVFEDGSRLAFVNSRRLGRIRLLDDPAAHPPVSELGYDALADPIDDAPLLERMAATSSPVKSLLLDQSFAAGVGNWVGDEVLYQARLHPAVRSRDLPEETARLVLDTLRHVVHTAVAANADADRFPRNWLFHHRWSKGKSACKDAEGRPIAFVTVGGRTSAFVPALQGSSPSVSLRNAVGGGTSPPTRENKATDVKGEDIGKGTAVNAPRGRRKRRRAASAGAEGETA